MRWQLRCLVDNLKGILPFSHQLRQLKRRLVPYQSVRSYNDFTLKQGLKFIQWLNEADYAIKNRTVLEIGTGWEPIIPLLFRLAGAGRVYLTDMNVLLSRETLVSSIDFLRQTTDRYLAAIGTPAREVDSLLAVPDGAPLPQLLDRFGMQYLAPSDCRRLSLESQSVDLVFSRGASLGRYRHPPQSAA